MIYGLYRIYNSLDDFHALFTILIINKYLVKSSDILFQELENKSAYEV